MRVLQERCSVLCETGQVITRPNICWPSPASFKLECTRIDPHPIGSQNESTNLFTEVEGTALSLMRKGRSAPELARRFEPTSTTLRGWKKAELESNGSPAKDESNQEKIKPLARKITILEEDKAILEKADPQKDLCGDRDVPRVSIQLAKLLRVAHAMRGSRSFAAISANPNPDDSRREWRRLWSPPDRSAIASSRLLHEPKASAARDARTGVGP